MELPEANPSAETAPAALPSLIPRALTKNNDGPGLRFSNKAAKANAIKLVCSMVSLSSSGLFVSITVSFDINSHEYKIK
ncbi:hypothetical protein Dda3937_04521 [Dickeya dadantii 3937]|uniref:Uncharacterized protein n=1 Tax=Dickeya dadantii (strain 3937) TaxID=198628 RepID=E0SHN2_DICD3|nr:hypothetical protein Dda3937_04521 [Dickeya dadantii 3937]